MTQICTSVNVLGQCEQELAMQHLHVNIKQKEYYLKELTNRLS